MMDSKKFDVTRLGILIFLGVVLAALWGVAVYYTYEESKRAKYDVEIHPGVVSYGTHSTVTLPMVLTSPRRSVPMISGNAVREYAHSGHATMPSAPSGKMIYTTSSASVKNIGSGGGAGSNNLSYVSSGSSSSSRGIQYSSGGSISMPLLAVTPNVVSSGSGMESGAGMRMGANPRRAKPTGDGEEGEWSDGGAGDNDWWHFDDGEWVQVQIGDTRIIGGITYVWDGSSWVKLTEYEPQTPLGATPWLLMLILVAGYMLLRRRNAEF